MIVDCLLKTVNQPTPFDTLFDNMDQLFPAHHRYLADTLWSNSDPAQVLSRLSNQFLAAPSRKSLAVCVLPPPSPADVPPLPDAAFSMTAQLFVLCYAVWTEERNDASNRAWHRATMAALEPFAVGHYIGESDITTVPSRAAASFAPAQWARLQALRRRVDPNGLFQAYFDD